MSASDIGSTLEHHGASGNVFIIHDLAGHQPMTPSSAPTILVTSMKPSIYDQLSRQHSGLSFVMTLPSDEEMSLMAEHIFDEAPPYARTLQRFADTQFPYKGDLQQATWRDVAWYVDNVPRIVFDGDETSCDKLIK